MDKLKDKDLREALIRKEAKRTKPEVPVDFCDSIMEEIAPKQSRCPIWCWMAIAASLLLLIGIGVTLFPFNEQPEPSPLIVQTVRTVRPDSLNAPSEPSELSVQTVRTTPKPTPKPVKISPKVPVDTVVVSQYTDPNLHYAAEVTQEDTTAYQDPARMDEFIAKLAAFNEVKAVPLNCSSELDNSIGVSTAYVFEGREKLDLFARLLQAACWYDSKTPGYLLNFSRQQFFFTLKDLRKGEKYIWLTERLMDGRILLFCTHSPIEAPVSLTCYQAFLEQLTNTNNNISQF